MKWGTNVAEKIAFRDRVFDHVLKLNEWVKWYAWYPVKINVGSDRGKWVWREYVDRQHFYVVHDDTIRMSKINYRLGE